MKSKKGFMPIIGTAIMVVGVVVIVTLALKGLGINILGGSNTQLNIQQTNRATQERIDQQANIAAGGNLCGDAKTNAFNFIASNPNDNSGTTDYNAVSVKVKPAVGGAIQSYTTDTDGTFASSSLSLNCPAKYDAYVVVSKNTTGSAGPLSFDTANYGPTGDLLIDIPDFDHISVKAYDEVNHGAVYESGDTTAGTAYDMATTGATFYTTSTNFTAYALGNSEELDMTYTLSVAAYKQWGDVENYVIVDADSSDYADVTVSLDGVSLRKVGKDVFNSNDQGYLSNYEHVFAMPQNIGSMSKDLGLKVLTKSTGTVDADIKVRFISKVYRVTENGKDIEKTVFNSAGEELYAYPPQEFTLDIQ